MSLAALSSGVEGGGGITECPLLAGGLAQRGAGGDVPGVQIYCVLNREVDCWDFVSEICVLGGCRDLIREW